MVDPTDPYTMYSESQGGALTRVDLLTDERKSIRPPAAPGEQLRFNWSAPLVISKYDNRTLYFGGNFLFKSTDRGDSWTRLGGDLTRRLDRDTLPIMGFRSSGGLGRHDGTQPFGNIATVAESPVRQGLLWVGTDDGLVHVTRDDGRSWTKFERFPGVPDLTYVSRVIASAHHEGTAYVTLDGHRSNDFTPYVLKTTDFGRTWSSIAANLPAEGSVQVIREHHRNPNLLFVGTEFGVFASVNGGGAWVPLQGGFPTVAVHDLVIHPRDNDLVVGTHGRGIYILDDITPLEKLAEAAASANVATVFTARPATAYTQAGGPGSPGDREYFAANPLYGALISYFIGPAVASGSTARLAIVDGQGAVVRELAARADPGVHRVSWDLRWASPAPPPDRPAAEGEQGGPPFGGAAAGPLVREGTYRAQLQITSGGQSRIVAEAPVNVRRDPLVRLADAEYAELNDWRMRAYTVQRDANTLVRELDQARRQLAEARQGADSASAASSRAREIDAQLDSALVRIRGRAAGPGGPGGGGFGGGGGGGGAGTPPILNSVNGVANVIGTTHFPVTAEQKQTVEKARADLEAQRSAARQAIESAASLVRELRR
jgi:hypothetical protein